jgi:SsrA-binding protein
MVCVSMKLPCLAHYQGHSAGREQRGRGWSKSQRPTHSTGLASPVVLLSYQLDSEARMKHPTARGTGKTSRPGGAPVGAAPSHKPSRAPDVAVREIAVNRAAAHNYVLLERLEAGIVLSGTEVKSIRAGRVNLKDAYGLVKDGELWLLNAHISPYEHGNIHNHDPLRTRKLLVHREQLRKLIGKTQQRGFTLIPTRMYFKNGKVKVELALARGKQLWDKRETERRRTAEREAREAMARARKGR